MVGEVLAARTIKIDETVPPEVRDAVLKCVERKVTDFPVVERVEVWLLGTTWTVWAASESAAAWTFDGHLPGAIQTALAALL